MKLGRVILALLLTLGLAGVAYAAQQVESSGARMVRAADHFLAALSPELRGQAVFEFDDKERLNWHFVPLQDRAGKPLRKGVRLEQMSQEQRQTALELLQAGTSASGDRAATTIMSLESILREVEKGGTNIRKPGWYFFTVFGKPSATGKWGWRVEGHHLSLNFTLDGARVIASTPAFFGANPATVKSGSRKGLRTLPAAEDLAIRLFKTLDEPQRRDAFQERPFPEVAGRTTGPRLGAARGLAAARMTEKQRGLLMQLIQAYAERMPDDVSATEIAALREKKVEEIHFAYSGGTEPGQPHTYRVQGPTFVIEFLNVQADSAGNPANHIHSVWRDTRGDFGLSMEKCD